MSSRRYRVSGKYSGKRSHSSVFQREGAKMDFDDDFFNEFDGDSSGSSSGVHLSGEQDGVEMGLDPFNLRDAVSAYAVARSPGSSKGWAVSRFSGGYF